MHSEANSPDNKELDLPKQSEKKNCMLQSFLTMDVIDLYSVKHHQKEVNSCQSSSKYR